MTSTARRPEPPFEDQRALIYGAARGIGRAVALEFARRGAAVAIADIDQAGAEETAQAIAGAGGDAIAVACDVRSDASVRAAADEATRRFGDVDIVMNNVGVILSGHPEDIPVAEWQRILDLNLLSTVRSLEVFLPRMLARGRGYIVNTASFAGLYPYATNRIPYAASKAAVVALTEGLALHLLPRGVRVSCLCPGPVATRVSEGMKSWSADAVMRGPGSQFRLLMPEEVAVTLADGMRDGRVMIPSHDEVFDVMREHAEAPDRFLHARLAAFARGENGLPVFARPEGR
jgi:NAD(P)-dependent dehydrogenase (short-subunit alcohol dehydrogenase family)